MVIKTLKKGLISFSLLTGSLFLAVSILEFGLRYFDKETPIQFPFENVLHPYVEFRPPANNEWHSEEPSRSSRSGEHATAFTNEDAIRVPSADYKLPRKKPDRQIRVAMLGGSTVHIGTTFDVTLPGALKRALSSRYANADIEVINGGIISAISGQELIHLLTTIVDYDIDVLITYDGINDTGQMLYYEMRPNFPYNFAVMEESWNRYVNGRKAPMWKLILNRSKILEKLWPQKYGSGEILRRISAQQLIGDRHLRRTFAVVHTENWKKIRRVCRGYEIRAFFVLQPTSLYDIFKNGARDDAEPGILYDNLFANYLNYEEFRKTTKEFAHSHQDIKVLDLSDILSAGAFYDGAHVYDEINDVIANRLVDLIADAIGALIENN